MLTMEHPPSRSLKLQRWDRRFVARSIPFGVSSLATSANVLSRESAMAETEGSSQQPTDRRVAPALRRAFDVAILELRRCRVSEHEIQAWLARKRSQLAMSLATSPS